VVGSFCTSVLRTTDPDRAVAFYGPLIGWTADPAAPGHDFLKHDGTTVASIHRVDAGPDEWVPHVLVEHIETVVADAARLGATLVDRNDIEGEAGWVHTVPKHGRIGSIFDPGGACLILRGPVPTGQSENR